MGDACPNQAGAFTPVGRASGLRPVLEHGSDEASDRIRPSRPRRLVAAGTGATPAAGPDEPDMNVGPKTACGGQGP
jgi:hypothetical protein